MRTIFCSVVLTICALFCLYTAWTSVTSPAAFAQQLGLQITNPGGINEIRSQYGGFFFAVGLVCLSSLAGIFSPRVALLFMATVFGGLIFGRLVSLIANGGLAGYGRTIVALYFIDSLGFGLALTAFLLTRSSAR
jgi:hypothetical protein